MQIIDDVLMNSVFFLNFIVDQSENNIKFNLIFKTSFLSILWIYNYIIFMVIVYLTNKKSLFKFKL